MLRAKYPEDKAIMTIRTGVMIFHKAPLLLSGPKPAFGKPGTVGVESLLADELSLSPGELVGSGPGTIGVVHVGTLIVSVAVETVPPNAKAWPVQVTVLPIVMPAASMSVPTKVELAPRVVAPVGVQNISHAEAPIELTIESAPVLSAPSGLNI